MDILRLPALELPPLQEGYLRMRFEQTFLHVILWILIRRELLCVDLTQVALPQGRILRLRALYLISTPLSTAWVTSSPPRLAPASMRVPRFRLPETSSAT